MIIIQPQFAARTDLANGKCNNPDFLVLLLTFNGVLTHKQIHDSLAAWRGIPLNKKTKTSYLTDHTYGYVGRDRYGNAPEGIIFHEGALFKHWWWRPQRGHYMLTFKGDARGSMLIASVDSKKLNTLKGPIVPAFDFFRTALVSQ